MQHTNQSGRAMIPGLQDRITVLEAENLDVAQELPAALECAKSDPAESLTKIRRTLERTLKTFLAWEGRPVHQKAMVGELLKVDVIVQKIPVAIRAGIEYANRVASSAGTHVGEADFLTALRALDHACEFIEWYAASCLLSGLSDNFGVSINTGDVLILYVSLGGTCRCAMANVITRHYLGEVASTHRMKLMSTALHPISRPTISPLAVQVLREELGYDASSHRTIQADERYIRRAKLLLTMDAKLLTQVPHIGQTKAFLFSKFYGGSGNIDDPLTDEPDIETYRDCYHKIEPLIAKGLNALVNHVTVTETH
jgi:protein-tyrosine-phosphatase